MDTFKKRPELFKLTGDWSVQSKELRRKFAELTDPDLKPGSAKENNRLNGLELGVDKKRDIFSIIKKDVR